MNISSNNSSFDLFDNDNLSLKPPTALEIIHIVIQVFLFGVGLHFQVRTIMVCIQEKNKTWQIHISHSVVMSIYYGYFIPFAAIAYFIPSVGTYIGNGICYFTAFVSLFCYQAMIVNSLLVAITKYIFICHTWKARLFGEERIQRIFLYICIIYPIIMATLSILFVRNGFDNRSEIKSCFGNSFSDSMLTQSSNSDLEKSWFCDIASSDNQNAILIYVAKIVCVTRSFVSTVVVTNIPEGIFYFTIFRSMKRYVKSIS